MAPLFEKTYSSDVEAEGSINQNDILPTSQKAGKNFILTWKTRNSDKVFESLPQRRRKDIRPRKGRKFCFDKPGALGICAHHEEYSHGGTTLKGLARFDDCRNYGVSEESERRLIGYEIDRLIVAIGTDGPFLFDSGGVFHDTGDDTFTEISHIADQIRLNYEIIRHDNTMHVLEHCPDLMEDAVNHFKQARRRLFGRYKQDEVHVQGCQPKILEPPERNLKAYFALVDYVTSSIGRLLFRCATSKYWENHLLSVLAQWATKLKVLSHNPAHYAAQSLDQGEDTLVQLVACMETRSIMILKIRKAADAAEHKDIDALDQETDITARYYRENTFFREHVERLLKEALDSMLNRKDNNKAASSFELCTLVFRTGLDGVPTTLSDSRQGHISASSDAVRVNCSYTATELAVRNIQAIAAQPNLPLEGGGKSDPNAAVVDWEWSDQTIQGDKMRATTYVSRMDDLISILVPLGLTSTYTSLKIDLLMALASSGTEEDDPIIQFEPPPQGFEAHLTVSTAQFVLKQTDPAVAQFHDPDVCSVSASSSRLGYRARSKMYTSMLGRGARKESKHNQDVIIAAYERDKSRMGSWAVSEDAITIRCRPYVVTVILLATLLVFGGMAIPFAVGKRIQGVDPFQLTTFTWFVAGFFIILAKSKNVNEWPWHDFLRGQVVCRSIKDVCGVTGIDPQVVLMNLLHEERENILTTQGPYNGMFGRRSEGTRGFSIDVPVQLLTMLASGFVVLKVVNEKGEHLMCLDVRKGVEGVGTTALEDDQNLSCMDIGKDELQTAFDDRASRSAWSSMNRFTKAKQEKVIRLSAHNFRYNKVLGLYIRDSRFG